MGLQTGIFAELLQEQRESIALERRSSLENPQTPLGFPAEWLLDIFVGGRTDAGIRVSELTAFQVGYFLACVDLIAGSVAGLPMHIYERSFTGNGRAVHKVAYDHALYELIHLEPNVEMSRFTLLKSFVCHVLAWGNGYIEIQRDGGNRPIALWPRNPYKTRPFRLLNATRLEAEPWRPFPVNLPAGTMVYRTTDGVDSFDEAEGGGMSTAAGRLIPAEDVLHVPGIAFDGRIGQDIVWLSRQILGLALATEKFGAKYFANFARPSGILTAPAQDAAARNQARQSWQEAQGGENSNRVAVMPPGYDFKPISNKPSESQTVELEDRLRNKICAIFHVPPRMVGDTQRSSKNSAEQEGQEFLQYTLHPWLEAIKIEWKRKLFPSPGVGRSPVSRFYIDFDLLEMERPDAASREKFYATGRQWGFLNTNDIRGFEKLNPIEEPWAEEYWMPINMTLTETPLDPNHQDGAGNGDKPDPASERYVSYFGRLFGDAFGRVCSREKRDLKLVSGAFGPVLFSIRDAWTTAAGADLRVQAQAGPESDKFVAEYLAALADRARGWKSPSEEEIKSELRRAVKALRIAAYREAASLKAKEDVQQ